MLLLIVDNFAEFDETQAHPEQCIFYSKLPPDVGVPLQILWSHREIGIRMQFWPFRAGIVRLVPLDVFAVIMLSTKIDQRRALLVSRENRQSRIRSASPGRCGVAAGDSARA
jgi:hypothetical protein